MNAIIGDNGIITRAQEANMQSSIASLEEFLQLKYTENYEKTSKYQSKIEGLTNVYSEYFYIPAEEGIGGLRYVLDGDGHALYLIKKSGLPEEIRESLVGGDAGEESYADYVALNDVYGVTSNLKVYYCSGGIDSIKGLAKENLDNDNPNRVVFESDAGMSIVLGDYDTNRDGTISAQETKSVKKLTIKGSDGITSLDSLYNLNKLKELTLEDMDLVNMNGIENTSALEYIYFKNCQIADYTAVGKMKTKIKYLYFYNIDDTELSTFCSKDKGIGNYELSNLNYLAFVGNERYICSTENFSSGDKTASKTITTLSPLLNLSDATKNAVKYLSLQSNDLTSVSELKDFKSLYLVRIEKNKIKTLGEKDEDGNWNGLGNCSSLNYLYANNNLLGTDEIAILQGAEVVGKNDLKDSLSCLGEKGGLYYLRLDDNAELKWVDYLSNLTSLRFLYLDGCLKFENVASLKKVKNKCGGNFSINNKYSIDLLDSTTTSLDLANYNLTISSFEALKNYKELYRLNLENLKLQDTNGNVIGDDNIINTKVNEVLSVLTKMQYLKLKGIAGLKEISFVGQGKMTQLKELDLRGTKVVKLTNLNDYAQNLSSLLLDYANTDLSDIAPCINRFNELNWRSSGGWWNLQCR